MAKRRNFKKEKALRNQAYARKFRTKTSSGRNAKRRYGGDDMESTTGGDGLGRSMRPEAARL